MTKCPLCGKEDCKLPLDPCGAFACNGCFEILYDPREGLDKFSELTGHEDKKS
jgi:hypothetical protein